MCQKTILKFVFKIKTEAYLCGEILKEERKKEKKICRLQVNKKFYIYIKILK